MGKATAHAPSNIAFIKYWGARDLDQASPRNPSLSMTLDRARTTTTVVVHDGDASVGDTILLVERDEGPRETAPSFQARFRAHMTALRRRRGPFGRVEAQTRNAFPADAGLASSASGFAALTVAVSAALGDDASPVELSIRARLSGSGSASRSVLGGYVVWPAKGLPEEAAGPYLPADHWDLRDVIAIVETGKKAVSSLEGHRRADTSPHFARRQELLPARLAALGGSLRDRAFPAFASLLEEEAIELHLIAMSSAPPVYYWKPHTLAVMERVRTLRDEGLSCAFTMDAGANVHVICPAEAEPEVAEALGALPGVIDTIRDRVGAGPILDEKHLF